jgi:hypothetical protein
MAKALNIGPDEGAKAVRAWTEQTTEMRALGFKNAAEVAKFADVYGTTADQLYNATFQLREEFNLTDEQISSFVGTTFSLGEVTQDVAGAMEGMPEMLKRMRNQASRMGIALDGAKLADFAAQTNALAVGLFKVGGSADEARSGANEIAEAMLGAQRGFAGMFAGVEQELPEFIKELSIIGGDVNAAFKMMEQGPSGFVQGMALMVAEAKAKGTLTKDSLTFLGQRIGQVLGPEAAEQLVGFFREADVNTIRTMANTQNAVAELGKAANENFSTGRTLAENYERLLETLGDTFRKVGKKDVGEWWTNIRSGVNDAKKKIAELGADKGPLGDITRQLAVAQHIGPQAFLPKSLQRGATVMGFFAKKLQPVAGMLSEMGLGFNLSSVFKAAAAGVSLFGFAVVEAHDKGESWGASITKVANRIADEMVPTIERWGGVLRSIAEAFAEFEWGDLFGGLAGTLEDKKSGPLSRVMGAVTGIFADGKVVENFKAGWMKLWSQLEESHIVDEFLGAFTRLINGVVKPALLGVASFMTEQVPWGKIGEHLTDGIITAVAAAGGIWEILWNPDKALAKRNLEERKKEFADTAKAAVEARANIEASAGLFSPKEGEIAFGKGAVPTFAPLRPGVTEANTKPFAPTWDAVAGALPTAMPPVKLDYAPVEPLIASDVSLASQIVTTEAAVMDAALAGVHDAEKARTAKSLHTDIGMDVELATQAVASATQRMTDLFMNTYDAIVDGAGITFPTIEDAASGLILKLESLATAQQEIAAARDLTVSPAVDQQRDIKIREARGDQATHNPEWYRGSTGYAQLFEKKMDALISAVRASEKAASQPKIKERVATAKAELASRRGASGAGIQRPPSYRTGGRVRAE